MPKTLKTMGNDSEFSIRFWGVRGSYPVCSPGQTGFGGNTPCIEVRAGRHLIILDAGTGIIHLGEKLQKEQRESSEKHFPFTLLFSHAHHDHTQGFPFFPPLHNCDNSVYIFGPRYDQDFEKTMDQVMLAPLFPIESMDLKARQIIRNFEECDAVLLHKDRKEPEVIHGCRSSEKIPMDSVRITSIRNLCHPKGGVLNYRISWNGKNLVYATDIEGYSGGDVRLTTFSLGADLLIHDTMYKPDKYTSLTRCTQGYGHSTYEMAVEVARRASVKKLVLFHHDPAYTDKDIEELEEFACKLFPDSVAAREGMKIEL